MHPICTRKPKKMKNPTIKPGQLITGNFNYLNEVRRNLRIINIEKVIQEKAHEVSMLLLNRDKNRIRIKQIEHDIIFFQEMLQTLSDVPSWVDLPLPSNN